MAQCHRSSPKHVISCYSSGGSGKGRHAKSGVRSAGAGGSTVVPVAWASARGRPRGTTCSPSRRLSTRRGQGASPSGGQVRGRGPHTAADLCAAAPDVLLVALGEVEPLAGRPGGPQPPAGGGLSRCGAVQPRRSDRSPSGRSPRTVMVSDSIFGNGNVEGDGRNGGGAIGLLVKVEVSISVSFLEDDCDGSTEAAELDASAGRYGTARCSRSATEKMCVGLKVRIDANCVTTRQAGGRIRYASSRGGWHTWSITS